MGGWPIRRVKPNMSLGDAITITERFRAYCPYGLPYIRLQCALEFHSDGIITP
jgi:hypothetical protein